jgi:hypothetical protein
MEDLTGAACAGNPDLFDPDTHHHLYLGQKTACWICDEAFEVCSTCPVWLGCFNQGRRLRESWMIRAGYAWTNGRPRDLRKRRT